MQDLEKLREIESLGQEDEDQEELEWELPEKSGGGGISLLQAVICALALAVLLFFKLTDTAKYQEIVSWYGQEMAREIELPQLERVMPTSEPSPSPTLEPPVSKLPDLTSAPPQML